MVFSPFEKRAFNPRVLVGFVSSRELEAYRQANFIRISPEIVDLRELPQDLGATAVSVFVGTAIATVVFANLLGVTNPWVFVAVPIITVVGLAWSVRKHTRVEKWNLGVRAIAHALSLALVLTIGIGVPVAAFYFFGGGQDLMAGRSPDILGSSLTATELALTRLGRILQLVFVATVSLLPALLFFLFDRLRMKTLQSEFQRQIFRLDPHVRTLTDVETRYGSIVEETFGSEQEAAGRLVRGNRRPIFVATVVITLAWAIALLPSGMDVPMRQPSDLFQLFVPQPRAIVFGFLGAYFFSLQMILRRYARGDLRPKAYTHITVRIIIVVILCWLLQLVFTDGDPELLIIAFFLGIFPERGLTLLRDLRPIRRLSSWSFPTLDDRGPLTDLEGIDLYDRARLLDEGVTNIESLAHHDLVELVLQTRIPAARLVDWVDQAILYLHVSVEDDQKASKAALAALRNYGIRTATDLRRAYDAAKERDGAAKVPPGTMGPEVTKLFQILPSADPQLPARLQVILDTLEDDEWLEYVVNWRNSIWMEGETVELHPDSLAFLVRGWQPVGAKSEEQAEA